MNSAVTSSPVIWSALTVPSSRSWSIAASNRFAGIRSVNVPVWPFWVDDVRTNPPLLRRDARDGRDVLVELAVGHLHLDPSVADDLGQVLLLHPARIPTAS